MEDRCGNCPRLAPTDRDSDTEQLTVPTTITTVSNINAPYLYDSDTEIVDTSLPL